MVANKYIVGMTWEEFINSEYNNNDYVKLEDGIVYSSENHFGEFTKVKDSEGYDVKGTDLIKPSTECDYYN